MPSLNQESTEDVPASLGTGTKRFSMSLATPNGSKQKGIFNLQSSARASDDLTSCHPYQLHDDDLDEPDVEEQLPAHQVVTDFDAGAGGAIHADGRGTDVGKRELIIKVESENNWRDRPGVNIRRPRTKNLLPQEIWVQQQAAKEGHHDGVVETEIPNMSHGLSYAQSRAVAKGESLVLGEGHAGDVATMDADSDSAAITTAAQRLPTQDEIALQALIDESKGQPGTRRTDLVIEAPARDGDEEDEIRYDETSSFRADVATRPDPASIEAYAAVPVEEFGAALLRGMGWKEGQPIGRGRYSNTDGIIKPRIPERRPGFLGIGAKDLSGGKGSEAEIGAWGKAAMRKSSRKTGGGDADGVYMPVLMRSKKTGKLITEEEFRLRQQDTKERNQSEADWRERRDRNLEKNGRDRDQRYIYEAYEASDGGDINSDSHYHERRRNGSSRRDRSRSSGERDRHYRRYDDEDGSGRDNRYYRNRDGDHRDRDRNRDRDRDRDRDRKYRETQHIRDDDRHSSRRSSTNPPRRDRDRDRGPYRRSDDS